MRFTRRSTRSCRNGAAHSGENNPGFWQCWSVSLMNGVYATHVKHSFKGNPSRPVFRSRREPSMDRVLFLVAAANDQRIASRHCRKYRQMLMQIPNWNGSWQKLESGARYTHTFAVNRLCCPQDWSTVSRTNTPAHVRRPTPAQSPPSLPPTSGSWLRCHFETKNKTRLVGIHFLNRNAD